ncbi:MAG: ribosome silencing factor [Planctomycetota bacterium]
MGGGRDVPPGRWLSWWGSRAPRARPTNHPGVETIESKDLAFSIARIIDEKQADDIAILDVSGPLVIADYFVVASARNQRHARALASDLIRAMKQEGRLCRHTAGAEGGSNWVLLDFDDVVVHLFQAEARSFYDLESLWADVPRVEFVHTAREVAPTWESLGDSSYPDSGDSV